MLETLFIVLIFPLAGALINGVIGAKLPQKFVTLTALLGSGLAFLSAVPVFIRLLLLEPSQRLFEQKLFPWIVSGNMHIDAGLQLDPLSGIMLLIVTGVGFLIHVYSVGYMHEEKGYYRYFSYLNLFLFAMLILILGNSFLMMFIGWEGVGLCSYLLIGFYYEKKSAGDAGKKAFIMNRIGDFGFLVALFLIFTTFGSLRYNDIFPFAFHKLANSPSLVTAITLLLFLGATGKSAQIPLYTWLPDAMEGPTPVSALIHAATMVTAGVYMVVRAGALFVLSPLTMSVIAVIGAVTAIFAATIALVQKDIKKVLAYSTVSQLGFMFLAAGVGAFGAAIFHVMTHAFFKATLFLGSGSVIHALHGAKDPQDMSSMGGLRKKMPITYWTFLISALAIAGIFPFSGFFSKDEILFETFAGGHYLLWTIAALTAFLTAFYMFRLVILTFHGSFRGDEHVEHHIHESPVSMTLPLIVLSSLAAVAGFLGMPAAMGENILRRFLSPVIRLIEAAKSNLSLNEYLLNVPVTNLHDAGHIELEWILMGVSLAIAVCAILSAIMFYSKTKIAERLKDAMPKLHSLLEHKYYIDEIYDRIIVEPIKNLSSLMLANIIDKKMIDGIINGVARTAMSISDGAKLLQNGKLRSYAFIMLMGLSALILIFIVM